jgi:hypothetical protein
MFLVFGDFVAGDPGGIRTHDPQLRRLLLYPAELPGQNFIAKVEKFKLLTSLPAIPENPIFAFGGKKRK